MWACPRKMDCFGNCLRKPAGFFLRSRNFPKEVVARTVESGETLYVNTTPEEVVFPAEGRSLFTGETRQGEVRLPAYEVELLEPVQK